MAAMFQLPSLNIWNWLPGRQQAQGIKLPSVTVHDIETATDERAKTLKHLIRANHINHSIQCHDLHTPNQMPHMLGSAYILGALPEQLKDMYDVECKKLEPWPDSPGEVARHDWRKHLGDKSYARAFTDFFKDELVRFGYDWKKLLEEYFFADEQPLLTGVFGIFGHPLVHLGYAYELSNRWIAIEALAVAATQWDDFGNYFVYPWYTRPSEHPTTSPVEILTRVRRDKRFYSKRQPAGPGPANIHALLDDHEDALLEHWNSWTVSDPATQFRDAQHAATLLLVGTATPGTRIFDFYLAQIVTTSHAVRVLLPLIPAKFQVPLLRQWWLFTLLVYVLQLRPEFETENVMRYDLKGRGWDWVRQRALKAGHAVDARYINVIHALKEAAQTWGGDDNDDDADDWYLRAAVRFADDFEGWGGFGDVLPKDVPDGREGVGQGGHLP